MKVQLGVTEVVHDNVNPVFVKTIEAEFHFEEQHNFLI